MWVCGSLENAKKESTNYTNYTNSERKKYGICRRDRSAGDARNPGQPPRHQKKRILGTLRFFSAVLGVSVLLGVLVVARAVRKSSRHCKNSTVSSAENNIKKGFFVSSLRSLRLCGCSLFGLRLLRAFCVHSCILSRPVLFPIRVIRVIRGLFLPEIRVLGDGDVFQRTVRNAAKAMP